MCCWTGACQTDSDYDEKEKLITPEQEEQLKKEAKNEKEKLITPEQGEQLKKEAKSKRNLAREAMGVVLKRKKGPTPEATSSTKTEAATSTPDIAPDQDCINKRNEIIKAAVLEKMTGKKLEKAQSNEFSHTKQQADERGKKFVKAQENAELLMDNAKHVRNLSRRLKEKQAAKAKKFPF